MTNRQRDRQIKAEKENDPKGNEKIKGRVINTRNGKNVSKYKLTLIQCSHCNVFWNFAYV